VASAWRSFWVSRALVFLAAMAGLVVFGTSAYRANGPGAIDPTGSLNGVLLSPFRRWDAGWFLSIAEHGYNQPTPDATAFFPLYPLSIRVVAELLGSFEWAGVLVSAGALMGALYLLRRLAELEIGRPAADRTLLMLALYPMSFYLSAIYSESLFLMLTVGCVYSARRGWWGRAGILGALAAAARNSGIVLVIPLTILALYGPRDDRPRSDEPRRGWPRYRPGWAELAAVAMVPLGLLAYLAYIRVATRYGATAPIKAHEEWGRHFRGPVVGVWGALKHGLAAARHLLGASTDLKEPVSLDQEGLINLAALCFASAGVIGAMRRLPTAYWAYALAGVVFALSFPTEQLVVKSLPRLIIVLFPLFMWLGVVTERPSYRTIALVASATGLALFSALFASGYWIA
jgi:mannosyltransferase PIG-V